MSTSDPRSPDAAPASSPSREPSPHRSRIRRWLVRLGVVAAGLLLLLAVLPQIVAWSPLRHEFPRMRLRGFTGNIRVARASLSWWGPTVLEGIELDDLDGKVFAKIRHYTEQRSVFAMALQLPDPSIIHAEGAEITAVLRPDGSNFEEAMRPVIAFHSSRPKRARTIDVVDSVLHVTDSSNGKQAEWKQIGLTVHTSPVPKAENSFKITASLADAPEARPLELEYAWTTPTGDSASAEQKERIRIDAENLPLRFLEPLHSRMAADLELSGELTANLEVEILRGKPGASGFDARGHLAVHHLDLACPSRIGSDRLALNEFGLKGGLSSDSGLFQAKQLEIDSELGRITANGKFPVVALSGDDPEAAADRLQQGDFELKGDLDLVQIARRLPDTLGLKSGARLSEGKLSIDVACRGGEKVARWNGSLETSRLAGEVEGRPVAWEQPIRFTFDVTRSPDHFKIEKFDCQSDVLELSGHGNSNSAHFEARCDLSRLTGQLGQFLDFQDRRWQGTLSGSANLAREEGNSLTITSAAVIENFALHQAGKENWSEPHLALGITCQLTEEHLRPRQIISLVATLSGVDENDSIKVTLVEPVDLTAESHAWNLAVNMAGDLERWRTRLHFGNAPDWAVAGTLQSTSRLRITDEAIHVDEHSADVTGLQVAAHGMTLSEPVVKLTGAAQWNRQERRLAIPAFEASAASGRISGKEILWSRGEKGLPALAGRFLLDSDLALLNPPDARESERPWEGTIHGEVALSHNDGQTRGDWRVDVENLIIRRETTKLVERRRGDVEQIKIDAPPIEVPRPPPGTVIDRRMRRAIEKAEREARREAERREKAVRKMADEIVVIPVVEWKTVWADPKLTLRGATRFDSSSDDIELEQLALETAGLNWSAHGTLKEVSSRRVLDLAGEVDYDVAALLDRLQESIGRFIKLTGNEHRTFTLQGPLRSPDGHNADAIIPLELTGSAAGGWQSGTLFGLDAGPGEFNLRLSDAVVAMQPFEFALSGGKLRMAPQVRLASRPAMLYVPKGPVLENVALTQEVCDGWMKFIAPVLAEATRAEGRFSLSLEESQLPLFDLSSGEMDGQLQIASGQVLPGPMFAELAGFLSQIEGTIGRGQAGGLLSPDQPLMLIDRQAVNFRLRNKRLYHSPMTFNVKGVPVRTRGSVGADQSLDLLAEIMFPAPWARRVPLIAQLDGKVFEVPIRGTLRHPKLDGRAIGKAWEQFGLEVLDNLLNGGLIPR